MRAESSPGTPPSWFPRDAPALLSRLRSEGGFTVDPRTGAVPTRGFAVNTGSGALVAPAQELFGPAGTDVLSDFIRSCPELQDATSTLLLGGWYHRPTDRVVLSCVDQVDDRDRAVAMGVARRQTDVYDLARGRLVPTGIVR